MARIAIVMPAYNCKDTIKRAISSIQEQSFTDWHLYIVNDASKDGLLDILDEYSQDSKITIINNEINLGAAESRNVGLRSGSEEFVAFLDSDDAWHKDKLKLQVECIDEGYNMIISSYNYIKPGGAQRGVRYKSDFLEKNAFLKKDFRVCFSSVCYRRFDLEFKKIGHEDYIFLNDLFNEYGMARVVRKEIVNYYAVEGSLSDNKKRAIAWHLDCLRYLFKNNLKIAYYFSLYVVNALFFKWKVR